MILLFIKGIGTGLLFAFSFGPSFFANINASMSRGFGAGAMVVAGISLTDSTYTLLSIFGLSTLLEDPSVQFWVTIVGGLMILTFGFINFLKPAPSSDQKVKPQESNYFIFFTQGLLIK